jgi:polyribonucleotide nucleotidyltransferase
MNKIVTKQINFKGKTLKIETGELAMMANNAVVLTYGETTILATVVMGEADSSIDFFDLRVHYDPKLYAAGMIKSSKYIKRDGKPSDEAIITRRLIDHAIRPLFPKDFANAVQVIVSVLSLDKDADPEFASLLAASAVLHSSKIPFYGPMTSVKVGMKNEEVVINPTHNEIHELDLNMIISFSGDDRKFLAVEAEANILPEEKILKAINEAHSSCEELVKLLNDFANEVNPGLEKIKYDSNKISDDIYEDIKDFSYEDLKKVFYDGLDKTKLSEAKKEVKHLATEQFKDKYESGILGRVFEDLEKKILQKMILEDDKRPDGRSQFEIRPLTSKVSYLPKVHGSGLFTRGITQALSVATLGSLEDALVIQDFYGEEIKHYMHFYNFPPYCSGEIGKTGGAGSREIGHGMLAEKGLKAVIPSIRDFPYTIIVNTEITSSSGSTSMAAACGSCLALMDAGVPLKDMVAGIGVGLVVNDDFSKFKIITDIAYLEDAGGFMDFKMIGTRDGVTAIQCDIKLTGIPINLMPEILEQSKKARMEVLDHMKSTISEPRKELAKSAPKVVVVEIHPEKIGIVFGSGGKTIKEIQAKTNTTLSIEETGRVVISGIDSEMLEKAKNTVIGLTKDITPGEIYTGKVVKIVDFGAFIEILPGKEGLLHVSEIGHEFIKDVKTVLKEGQEFEVKVISTENGKISLSRKALLPKPEVKKEEA